MQVIHAEETAYLLTWNISAEPEAQLKQKRQKKTQNKIKIRPKLLNFAFCRMRYSRDVFLALAERNSSIFSWKSGLRGTSSWVNDFVSLSFCSIASWTWLANTGIVRSREVLGTFSSFGRGNPAMGGLCVNFELNIFIFSIKDSFAGSSSSNLAATSECVRIYIILCVCLSPNIHKSRTCKKETKPTIKDRKLTSISIIQIYMLLVIDCTVKKRQSDKFWQIFFERKINLRLFIKYYLLTNSYHLRLCLTRCHCS